MIRILLLLLMTQPAYSESLIAARTLRASSIVTASDVQRSADKVAGSYQRVDQVIGMETRVVLYAGRPILQGDVGPPAIVLRNQIVPLVFNSSSLRIVTEGRSLGRGAAGDVIRIMNLSSRSTVTGRIQADGSVQVGN